MLLHPHKARTWITGLAVAFAFASSAVPSAPAALTWNVESDFSVTNGNPNNLSGPRSGSSWSYGTYPDSTGLAEPDLRGFSLFTSANPPFHAGLGLEAWSAGATDPNISHNPTREEVGCCGTVVWAPNEISLSPAGASFAGARWTAPSAGRYNIVATFNNNQGASAPVYVAHNATVLYRENTGTAVGEGVTFRAAVSIAAAGETIDFIAGSAQNTELHATLMLSPGPFVKSTSPTGKLNRTNTVITVELQDNVTAVNPATIQLALNDQAVTPAIIKPAGTTLTTVRYGPLGALQREATNTVRIIFGDTSTPPHLQTNEFGFDIDTAPPAIVSARTLGYDDMVVVAFSEAVAVPPVSAFAIDKEITVTGVSRSDATNEFELTTTPFAAGKPYTLTVLGGVKDLYGNEIAPNSKIEIDPAVPVFESRPAQAVSVTREEMTEAGQWASAKFEATHPVENRILTANLPFSFTYGGKTHRDVLADWQLRRSSRKLDDQRTEHTLVFTDPKTGLVLRCVAIEYRDFPTVEWTLYFKNTGPDDTPILERIQALDIQLDRGATGEFRLHHHVGSPANVSDYAPRETALGPGTAKRIGAAGGRPTNSDLSYFNLEWSGQGLIMVVGWPGQWEANFTRDNANGLHVRAGQQLTHFKLHPGEEVRSPLMVLQFWKGDWVRAQNIWRRWMLAHSTPKPDGKPLAPFVTADSSAQFGEMIGASTDSQIYFINRYLQEKLKIDYWWMDAGWYVCDGSWPKTGTWEVDRKRFPNGLREITDHAHSNGIKIIVWFEPERVASGTWLTESHPEWILGGKNGGLLNLGNPAAWNWLANHIDTLLTEQGIDLYRQDFNMDPLPFWRANDSPDRQGITEIKHVVGYLAYWDELQRRHPGMLIDSCASGGRRNDVETMRRAVPLWRTDYPFDPIGTQCHTYGVSFWIPLSGTGVKVIKDYDFRSNAAPEFTCHWDVRVKDLDYDRVRRHLAEWREYAPNFMGDYYPLTAFSTAREVWMAWQFDRPEAGEGMIQVFRREKSPVESARFRLRGLDAAASYVVKNIDDNQAKKIKGSELIDRGLRVTLTQCPYAGVITYKKAE